MKINKSSLAMWEETPSDTSCLQKCWRAVDMAMGENQRRNRRWHNWREIACRDGNLHSL